MNDRALLVQRLSLASGLLGLVVFKIAGYSANVAFYQSIGFPLPQVMAPLNMALELGSGVLLVLGWQTTLAAALVIVDTLGIVTPVNVALGETANWWWIAVLRLGLAVSLMLTGPGAHRVGFRR